MPLVVAESTTRTPQQSRGIKTRAALLRAGAKEFSVRGYAKTTARSIAERAQTATGSYYQYFTNKDELLRELVAERHVALETKLRECLEGDDAATPQARLAHAPERTRRVVDVIIAIHRDDPGFHAVFTERRHADPELDRLISDSEARLVGGVSMLLHSWGFSGDAEATAFVLMGMLEGSIHAHVLGRPMVDDERFSKALVDAVMRIATSAG